MLKIRKANKNDIDTVTNLYEELINAIKDNEYTPQWDYGVYPKDETIIKAIEQEELYVGVIGSEIVSSIVINHKANAGYDQVKWKTDDDYENIYVVHLVAVKNGHGNKGIAKKMLSYVFDLAKENSIKSIRLSIIENNLPAEKVYKKLGFEYIDTITIRKDDRGLKTFNLYEKLI
ncbi:MAG: hypothetical protein BZ137_01335 [Methanosphaera sp. rholeuAM130]|nr:MAG: hypothetical protein BZ137_01335 [Methanosphaera sp. rholeuAM130]